MTTATTNEALASVFDPFGILEATLAVQRGWLTEPLQAQSRALDLARDWNRLLTGTLHDAWGVRAPEVAPAVERDARFDDPAWSEQPGFRFLKQAYLLNTRWLEDTLYATPGVDDPTRRRAAFWARQWLDAVAPTNALATNPAALRRAVASGGNSLLRGLSRWLTDLQAGSVRMVEPDAFRVGHDLAATPGTVVLRNRLLELIQYAPTTESTHATPLLLVSPWINKYYVLDLSADNSLIANLVGRGYTVFVTSWKNPGSEEAGLGLEDYMLEGVATAVEAVLEITGQPRLQAAGYCLGGTILAALMAWYNADAKTRGQRCPIASWTLFTTLTDFSDPGEIGVFLAPRTVAWLERRIRHRGYLDGNDMATSFRLLRPNSLIWQFAVHSYLLGEALPRMDVLYWNMDCTRMPAAMHIFYLETLYLQNLLAQPRALMLGGRRLDLGAITQPLYAVGCEQDHIAPWRQTFRVCALTGGPTRYTLATSGHILGIINPPADPPRRRYWCGDATAATDAERWLSGIDKRPGSWWDDWDGWLAGHAGARIAPPALGSTRHPPLAAAPGSYVLER